MYCITSDNASVRMLIQAAAQHRRIACMLPENALPDWTLPHHPTAVETAVYRTWQQQKNYLPVTAVSVLHHLLPSTELWLIPHRHSPADYACLPPDGTKPWFQPPPLPSKPKQVAVIGAGIAGAATARALAAHGVNVAVLESATIAHAASGNRQGLLYAKISPHFTEQTELLLCGYAYTRLLLDQLLPEQEFWSPCGVYHINHHAAETKRNRQLAEQTYHHHLYCGMDAQTAAHRIGLPELSDGLFWANGAWLHPPALVRALLDHPQITVYEHTAFSACRFEGSTWHIDTPQGCLNAEHIIYCTGADSFRQPHLQGLPIRLIRGQTSLAPATDFSRQLRSALSGERYISPAWQGLHCYGATFGVNDGSDDWRVGDEQENQAQLHHLHPALAASLLSPKNHDRTLRGHSAVRCDSTDHLPLVGPVGNAAKMQAIYAALAADKNLPINTPCPYLPNIWVNTAHGSRGLATAPVCAQSLAATILGLPNPLSWRIRQALHPNRFIIRGIVRRHSHTKE